jgi:hypothetical protein
VELERQRELGNIPDDSYVELSMVRPVSAEELVAAAEPGE